MDARDEADEATPSSESAPHASSSSTSESIQDRPLWQLPAGVSHGTWEYVQSSRIAEQYDDYFEFNELFEFDMQTIKQALETYGKPDDLIADLGSGTGRALVPLVELGYRGLAIDLSQRMLDLARWKAKQRDVSIDCLRSNLVELDGMADNSVDHAICLFSTLGMIRGSEAREQAVQHFRRIIRKNGLLVIHVHNYWFNVRDPGGPWWILKNLCRSVWDPDLERGDKYYPYRGLQQMYLHVFTRRELKRLLRDAGFETQEFVYLHPTRQRVLPHRWLLSTFRANGWIVICR